MNPSQQYSLSVMLQLHYLQTLRRVAFLQRLIHTLADTDLNIRDRCLKH